MSKSKFVHEVEIKASKKMLYPYLNTASGLAQWFADDVNINEDKVFNFIWEGDDHPARLTNHKTNSYARFEFNDDHEDPSYVEFKLDENELTQSVFLKVTEYSDFDDQEEQRAVWDNLLLTLKEIVGG